MIIKVENTSHRVILMSLGFQYEQIEEEGPKSEVIKAVFKCKANYGVIDEDPQGTKPSYYRHFHKIRQIDDKHFANERR